MERYELLINSFPPRYWEKWNVKQWHRPIETEQELRNYLALADIDSMEIHTEGNKWEITVGIDSDNDEDVYKLQLTIPDVSKYSPKTLAIHTEEIAFENWECRVGLYLQPDEWEKNCRELHLDYSKWEISYADTQEIQVRLADPKAMGEEFISLMVKYCQYKGEENTIEWAYWEDETDNPMPYPIKYIEASCFYTIGGKK